MLFASLLLGVAALSVLSPYPVESDAHEASRHYLAADKSTIIPAPAEIEQDIPSASFEDTPSFFKSAPVETHDLRTLGSDSITLQDGGEEVPIRFLEGGRAGRWRRTGILRHVVEQNVYPKNQLLVKTATLATDVV